MVRYPVECIFCFFLRSNLHPFLIWSPFVSSAPPPALFTLPADADAESHRAGRKRKDLPRSLSSSGPSPRCRRRHNQRSPNPWMLPLPPLTLIVDVARASEAKSTGRGTAYPSLLPTNLLLRHGDPPGLMPDSTSDAPREALAPLVVGGLFCFG